MDGLGFNTGYIDDLYKQYVADPNSVSESWREFFQDYTPSQSFVAASQARRAARPQAAPAAVASEAAKPGSGGDGAAADPDAGPVIRAASDVNFGDDDADFNPLRGASARIVENMENSLGMPVATSVRTIPVKLLWENRALINAYQKRVGGDKVSFTHIIAYAIVQALKEVPSMYGAFGRKGGKPVQVAPAHINLGLAIDIEKRGKRTLLVPNVKSTETMNFAQFLGTYNDLVARARDGKLEIADFQGTTASITNPGMIGTVLSVPRLMAGQGVIVGVGSIGYPPHYQALTKTAASKLGISPVMTLTSTYDHRVIQGAESGQFLKLIADALQGEGSFYLQLFADLGIPYPPYTMATDSTPRLGESGDEQWDMVEKQAAVLQLVRSYRVRGHLYADVNPLGYEWAYHTELDPASYGLTLWDLDRTFITGGLGGKQKATLREILDVIRKTYTGKVGIEYMHITSAEEKRWLQSKLEAIQRDDNPLDDAFKRRMLEKLNAAEAFERFLHTKYIGHKRFSLEGSESMIPVVDAILSAAAADGVRESVIGMAHRGRLNVLANIMGKPYENIFSEFEGNIDPNTMQGSGDVKYHLGAHGTHEAPGGETLGLTLASNPSHLEAVDPVVEGMARAKIDANYRDQVAAPRDDIKDSVLPLLIHGDAAFAGQGVVPETLNLSQTRGYTTGGSVHLVVNNQIGFTTSPSDARSTTYATDVARAIQAPIFHVNGDDPEACVQVAYLAFEYRQAFNKDVVIDLLTYRVHGHNEGDEPGYTQPILYQKIKAKRSVRKLYAELLLRRGDMEPSEVEAILDDFRGRLDEAFIRTKELSEERLEEQAQRAADAAVSQPRPNTTTEARGVEAVDTAVTQDALTPIITALTTFPEDFGIHKKLRRQFEKRPELFQNGKIDWGFGEALAFGSLLAEGTTIRLTGQDSRRGTFSHRHAVLYDQETGAEYIPLDHIQDEQASLRIYDSTLSEYAVCGFEYGYSVAAPEALVIWEAQFGDFANGAQIVFDQFMSSGEAKWGQMSSLVLLLPHGYEGQGPEHSSARLERFLQLCAENNMIVGTFTTPANYFHALRRQAVRERKVPLVVMTPKSLLRHPLATSARADFSDGQFQPVIPADAEPGGQKRLVFASGKVYYDLIQHEAYDPTQTAVARLEQFYPFPSDAVREEIERFGDAEVVWAQEEPANMGAWTFVRSRFDAILGDLRGGCDHRITYAGRPDAASPATGSAKVHAHEQNALVKEALGA